MVFNALHALTFCVDSVDIHSIECITIFDPLSQKCPHCQYILTLTALEVEILVSTVLTCIGFDIYRYS